MITDLHEGKAFYENCIAPHAVEAAVEMLEPLDYILETFIEGQAYIEGWYYRQVDETRESFRGVDYILNTRKPVDDFYQFMLDHKDKLENINVNFTDLSEKRSGQVFLRRRQFNALSFWASGASSLRCCQQPRWTWQLTSKNQEQNRGGI